MSIKEHQGFATDKPCSELLPVEALALVNRWVKVKNRFYYEDLDQLYEIKDEKISDWVNRGELIPTRVVTRESPVLAKIRQGVAISELNWLNYDSYEEYWSSEDKANYQLLWDLISNYDYYVAYPKDVYERWITEIQPKIEEYNLARSAYEAELEQREPFVTAYNQELKKYKQEEEAAAKGWAKQNNVKIARSNSGKSLKKDWLKRLKRQGFKYDQPKPINPFPTKLKPPIPVEYPDKTYVLSLKNYVPGTIPEIESLLKWVRSIYGQEVKSWKIDEDFVTCNFDAKLDQYVLEQIKKKVLDIFQEIVAGKYKTPLEIYNALIKYDVNYEEAIGMRSYFDRYNRSSHGDFGKWHEINLSETGLWLIEFTSTIDPDIIFHSPYNKNFSFDKLSLPKETSNQKKFGREINREEKKKYPIQELVKVLGYTTENFWHKLEKYKLRPRSNYKFDEYQEEDFDDDEFRY